MICKIYNFSHIFVWGSCFWFCIPSVCLRASSPHTPLCHTPLVTLHFVIHTHTHHLSQHNVLHTSLPHTHNFVTQCHNLSCTSLSHTALSHTHTSLSHQSFVTHTQSSFVRIFVTQLCHTHIIFHYTTFHTQLCHAHTHTQSFTTPLSHNFVTCNFVTHNLILTVSHTIFRNTIFHTHTHLTFVTLTYHLCGRRGTWWHPRCFCVVGQFALLWLLKVPTCSQPRRLGGLRRFSTWCSFVIHSFVTHNSFTLIRNSFTHTQLSHTHNSFTRNSFAHNSFTQLSRAQLFHIQLFEISDPPPSPLSFLPSLFCFNHCFWLFGEVDLWVCPVL